MEDDVDVYIVRAGAETFERPTDGTSNDWTIAEPPRKAQYVKFSDIVDFPKADFAGSSLTYADRARGILISVPTGYGVMQILPDVELKALKAAFYAARRP